MARAGVEVRGWIANHIDPDPLLADYPPALQALIDVPLLTEIPYVTHLPGSHDATNNPWSAEWDVTHW